MNNQIEQTNPTVFISYSHDSNEHADKVLKFANSLRQEGIDAILDQYETSPPEGWPRWMDKNIRDSQFVVMICTEAYCKRVMGDEEYGRGLGVRWEGNLIYQHIYNVGTLNHKFIPAIFNDSQPDNIPVPLQGVTFYKIDDPTEFDKLYWRLRGISTTEKPQLGKLRSMPERERKTDVGLYIAAFIDVELWDTAKWTSVLYMFDRDYNQPPFLGIAFENETAAKQIFYGWKKRFGDFDEFNELRISILEGNVEGEKPGYFFHIGPDLSNVIRHADSNGIDLRENYLLSISKFLRMIPNSTSSFLPEFKNRYSMFNSCFLIPAIVNGDNWKPLMDYKIIKRNIEFRMIDQIKSKDDPDSVVHPKFRGN